MAQPKDVRLVTEAKLDVSNTGLKAGVAADLAPIKNDVADLKVLGGLNPGSVNDTTSANLIETPGTQTHTALSAATVGAVSKNGSARPPLDSAYKIGESVKDYGAKGDGVTYDDAAIAAAIAATQKSRVQGILGGRLTFPAGEFVITDTINLDKFGGEIVGAGIGNGKYATAPGNATVIRWAGPAGKPMFKAADHRHLSIRNMRIEGNDGAIPSYGIQSNRLVTDGQGYSSWLILDNVYIGTYSWSSQGIGKGKISTGVGWTGDDGNNDQWHIKDCFIRCEDAGVYVANPQSIWGQIDNTTIWGSAIGVNTFASITANNIRFQLCGTDWKINSSAQVSVFGGFSENSAKLVHCTSAMGRFNQWGGVWTLHDRLGTGIMVQHDDATRDGGITLHGVKIDSQVTPHPKLQIRSVTSDLRAGRLTVQDCASSLTMADFDLSTAGGATTGRLKLNINTGTIGIKNYLMRENTTFTTAPSVYSGTNGPNGIITADIGSVYLRGDGAIGVSVYVKESGSGTNAGWNRILSSGSMGGPTGARPATKDIGQRFGDTTVNKLIWWNGTSWVDAMGTAV